MTESTISSAVVQPDTLESNVKVGIINAAEEHSQRLCHGTIFRLKYVDPWPTWGGEDESP